MFKKVFLFFSILIMLSMPVFAQDEDYASGKVVRVVGENNNLELEKSFHIKQPVQVVEVLVLNGDQRGKILIIQNQLTSNPVYDIKVKAGDRILLNIEDPSVAEEEDYTGVETVKSNKENAKENKFYIADMERVPVLMVAAGLFLLLVLFIGKKQGLMSLTGLIASSLMIFFVFVPAVLNNFPVILAAVITALVSTLITMFAASGVNKKSLSAILGTVLSVAAAGLLSSLVIKFAPLNGFGSQEAAILWVERPDLDYTGILTAGIIIASLGAIMDVGISIASSIFEFKSVNNDLKFKELVESGLNVGRDVMGTMVNTLILAYIGSSLPLVLLAANAPLVKLVNLNSIATEIASALTGSIGIILCVPITAVISGYLASKT